MGVLIATARKKETANFHQWIYCSLLTLPHGLERTQNTVTIIGWTAPHSQQRERRETGV